MKINLYSLLDIECDVSTKEIISAYRKKALKCHPDKNPNNPKAAEEFHLLSKALQLLTNIFWVQKPTYCDINYYDS